MDYSTRDVNRIAVSATLRRLADYAKRRVVSPTHDDAPGALAESLFPALTDYVSEIQDAVVAYERSRGAGWEVIGAATGLTPAAAAEKWRDVGSDGPDLDDLTRLVDELDRWYVWHVGFDDDPLNSVADPFTRLLDPTTGAGDPDCLVCRKYAGGVVPAWAGTATPPGGHVVETENWRVGHGPTRFWPAGTMLVEAKRHFLDYAEMTATETAEFGPLLGRVFAAVKVASGAERVHVFSSMDGAPHFHIWLVPRVSDEVLGKRFLATVRPCTQEEALAATERTRTALSKD